LDALDPDERAVIEQRYGLRGTEMTSGECAEVHGTTIGRIQLIEKRAMKTLTSVLTGKTFRRRRRKEPRVTLSCQIRSQSCVPPTGVVPTPTTVPVLVLAPIPAPLTKERTRSMVTLPANFVLTVEKNVPMPLPRGRKPTVPMPALEVGDSFAVPTAQFASKAARHYKAIGQKAAVRKLADGTLRVWRVK